MLPDGVVQYLVVAKLKPWLFSIGEDLPHNDSETPHVALRGELPVHDALRGHPADRQHSVSSHLPHIRGHQLVKGQRLSGGHRLEVVLIMDDFTSLNYNHLYRDSYSARAVTQSALRCTGEK